MTRQEIFNKAWFHFVTKRRSFAINQNAQCVYRTKNGAKCAIGCLIPDNLYSPKMDEAPDITASVIHNVYVQKALKKIGIRYKGNEKFLTAIQWAHDACASGKHTSIRYSLTQVAENYKLKVPKK
jgi:hypothetical protein